jgi:hypothetical protein
LTQFNTILIAIGIFAGDPVEALIPQSEAFTRPEEMVQTPTDSLSIKQKSGDYLTQVSQKTRRFTFDPFGKEPRIPHTVNSSFPLSPLWEQTGFTPEIW